MSLSLTVPLLCFSRFLTCLPFALTRFALSFLGVENRLLFGGVGVELSLPFCSFSITLRLPRCRSVVARLCLRRTVSCLLFCAISSRLLRGLLRTRCFFLSRPVLRFSIGTGWHNVAAGVALSARSIASLQLSTMRWSNGKFSRMWLICVKMKAGHSCTLMTTTSGTRSLAAGTARTKLALAAAQLLPPFAPPL